MFVTVHSSKIGPALKTEGLAVKFIQYTFKQYRQIKKFYFSVYFL